MRAPLEPSPEAVRLAALADYQTLDTPPEAALDDLTALAARLCDASVALVSLVDDRRQWCKSCFGTSVREVPRNTSFCAHAIQQPELFQVPDAAGDARFSGNPFVSGPSGIRFYAGAPLLTGDGQALGTLCVMDPKPRELSALQRETLRVLSRQVMAQLEQRRQARTLAESESRLRLVTENSRVGLVVVDRDRRYVYANHAYADILGLTSPVVVGQRVADVLPEVYERQIRPRLDRAFGGDRVAYELSRPSAEGERFYSVRYEPASADARPDLVLVVLTDISEPKRAAVAASRLAAIVESSNDAIIGKDLDGLVTSWNRGAEQLLGYSAAEMVGRSVTVIIPDDRKDEEVRILEQIRSGRAVRPFETVRRTRDGRLIDVSLTVSPIRGPSGEVAGASKVLRDITERRRAEDLLREREQQLRLYALHSPAAVAMLDGDMKYLVVSRRWMEDYRLPEASVIGRSHYEVFPDMPQRWLDIHQRCLAGAVEKSDEDAFVRENGTTDWLRWEIRPWHHADGSIGGVVIFSENITERKEREWALRASEGRYRTLFDTAPDGILIADRDSYYIDANPSTCRMLGYTRDELVGLHASDIVVPDEVSHIEPALEAIETGLEYHREWMFRRKDGSVFPAEVFATQMPDGNLLGMLRDVTERQRAVEALRTAEERMRFALQNANVGIWDMDYTTGVLRWSEMLEKHYGVVPGTFAGTNDAFMALVHPADRSHLLEVIEKAMRTGSDFTTEHRAVWPDGTVRWLSGAGRVLLDEQGRPARGVGISLDVTERHALEAQYQQAQKMEAVGRLAGGVAHDFNNLLTAILGYCELLLAGLNTGDPLREDISEIQKAGTAAARLTRQLLAFSRKQIIEPTLVDLNEIIAGVRGMLGRIIGEDVAIVMNLAPEAAWLMADRGQIEQVLLNLAVNARDAMPMGGTLRIDTAQVELDEHYAAAHFAVKPGAYVALEITDTGTGMSSEVQAHLFEPFYTTKELGKGTGLGLATVHGIVSRSGGSVSVYSEVGKGTSFKVYFPRADAIEARSEPEPTDAVEPVVAQTVLVVEDAEPLRQLTRRLLEGHGYTVLVAANAEEALHTFEQYPSIDVLLTDVVMPGASGPELTKALVERRPALKVIYMSGYTEDAIVHHGVLRPGIAFLHKPFTSDALVRKIREIRDR